MNISIDSERRLAAIFSADVDGYSRLMGNDEVGTLRDLTGRRLILDGLIAAHRGRIANTAGDSVLAEFSSAVDAVQCAVDAQAALADANIGLSPDRHIKFRIGVHVGDVMVRAGDLFGDGVNIAARLQGRAEAEGICISGIAYEQVRKILPLTFVDLGVQSLKNMEPMRVYSVCASSESSSSVRPAESIYPPLPDKPSIAVLPFDNLSGDPAQDYFADGMVEDITTALSRIKWLFVIARNSSFTYKGKSIDVKQVGRELGVRYVLEGSVRKSGNRVRINGQLIDAGTGTHIWANRFDGDLNDIFELQDKFTESVVGTISPKLYVSEFARANRKPTANLNAYDYYLRGASILNEAKVDTLPEALPLFRKAIELDPRLALAHGGLATWYAVRLAGRQRLEPEEIKAAIASARKAIELDREDGTVLAQAGWTLAMTGALDEGASYLKEATDADPNSAFAWSFRGVADMLLGRHGDAIGHFKNALRLSPLDPLIFITELGLAYASYCSDRYEEALQWVEASLRHNPAWMGSRLFLVACYASVGRIDAAKAAWEAVRPENPAARISGMRALSPLRSEEDQAKIAAGYRLAGVPE